MSLTVIEQAIRSNQCIEISYLPGYGLVSHIKQFCESLGRPLVEIHPQMDGLDIDPLNCVRSLLVDKAVLFVSLETKGFPTFTELNASGQFQKQMAEKQAMLIIGRLQV